MICAFSGMPEIIGVAAMDRNFIVGCGCDVMKKVAAVQFSLFA
jgi:hypothetical protein